MLTINNLANTYPKNGELVWIGLRPGKKMPLLPVEEVQADSACGLIGDHYNGKNGTRQVTLFQWEHLAVLSALLDKPVVPEQLRRNLVIKGLNLLPLKQRKITIGNTVLLVTGACHPCSRMETALGEGAYNAMRGHGGMTAQVLAGGLLKRGDPVSVVTET
ncbi:MAG: MOSC domain-containing protein [Methylicorpusculum sp.]|uniref:MOSC domain-containing protein n=1 Tax=Methylicorpusculum sp. TaxID=2713644 RepID=UPI002730F7F8|nr:MOSC domain-containing protein [Methylicorpusculum sp.]MDP2180702.1 MOSC domain-containing protein [Methylicorpusculum sp.]